MFENGVGVVVASFWVSAPCAFRVVPSADPTFIELNARAIVQSCVRLVVACLRICATDVGAISKSEGQI